MTLILFGLAIVAGAIVLFLPLFTLLEWTAVNLGEFLGTVFWMAWLFLWTPAVVFGTTWLCTAIAGSAS